ncbi:hypothetical protein G5714_006896 [Onychostoma macrolepis]|uniref:Retrotransposon gag domain-containing protein n=1 Tax=Onychostoma macrolepis TaxID=369639 RepID=A0A7J6CY86_9TELE|nr:hypothetical protein G5714_006896 [Onychostoma macrolepis]
MGPAGKFLDIRQGDRSIEDYAGDFVRMARQSATEKTCLMVIFWGGLADPFKSLMPYWAPEESLEDYINLALQLSGSAFRVELAAEPAPEAAIKGARGLACRTQYLQPTPRAPRADTLRAGTPADPSYSSLSNPQREDTHPGDICAFRLPERIRLYTSLAMGCVLTIQEDYDDDVKWLIAEKLRK